MSPGILNALANLLTTLSTFVFLRIFISKSGQEIVGVWALIQAGLVISRLSEFGSTATTVRRVVREASEKSKVRFITLVSAVLAPLILGVIFCILAIPFTYTAVLNTNQARLNGVELSEAIFWMSLAAFVQTMGAGAGAVLEGVGKISVRSAIQILFAPTLPLLALTGPLTIDRVAKCTLIQASLLLVAYLIACRSFIKNSPLGERGKVAALLSELHHQLRESYSLSASSIFRAALEPLSKYCIGWASGAAYVVVFDIALKIVTQARVTLQSVCQPLLRLMSDNNLGADSKIQSIRNSCTFLQSSTLAIFACLVLGAPVVSLFFFSKINADFVYVFLVLSIGSYVNTLGTPGYLSRLADGGLKDLLVITILMVIINAAFGGFGFLLKSGLVVSLGYALSFSLGGLWGMRKLKEKYNFLYLTADDKKRILFLMSVASVAAILPVMAKIKAESIAILFACWIITIFMSVRLLRQSFLGMRKVA